ncbi:hypothetical protein HDU85_000705 [Gaertneriomyces sp. JEL0708]|nr:hypothetical protein HDU85_000705 [Gaertneriomyces sp. JEL0708]
MFSFVRSNFSAAMKQQFGAAARAMSTKNLYVGNLSWQVTNNELSSLFAKYGRVQSARVILANDTGRSRGFGFVEMDESEAIKAMEELNGTEFKGRNLKISEGINKERRQPRQPRSFNNDENDSSKPSF